MNKLIQVFDSSYIKQLEKMGLRVINVGSNFTLMSLNDKVKFEALDTSKVSLTSRMTF